MNILIIGRGIPTEQNPKLGIFEMDQAKALAGIGNKVKYFAVDLRSIRKWRKWGLIKGESDGVKWYVYNLPVGPFPVRIRSMIGSAILKKMYDDIILKPPDVIHAHFTKIGHMALGIANKNGIPLIITEHSSEMNNDVIQDSVLKFAKVTYSGANQVIAVSKALSDNLKEKIGINCEVIPNIMGDWNFLNCKKIPHMGMGYLSICDLIEHKRPELLIRSFAWLTVRHDDVYLVIIGDGKQRRMLEILTADLGIKKKVKFYGKQTREQIAKIFRKYDCFVLPSIRETFGVAYIEAMSAGLPVIATKCGGPEEFVTKENGILISTDNGQELVNAMEEMYCNGKKYDSERISGFVQEHFSPDIVAERICSLYRKVINESM